MTRTRLYVLVSAAAVAASAACHRAPTFADTDLVTVADFANATGDAMFDESLRQVVINQLQQSPYFVIVPDQRIQRTLRSLRRSPNEPVVEILAREVCQKLGARATVNGGIAKAGEAFTITLDAVDCATGASIGKAQTSAPKKEDVIAKVGDATTELRKALGEPADSLKKYDVPAVNALTKSIDALRPYAMGNKIRATSGDEGAIPFFERAGQLDAEFAQAWSKLGVAASNTGHVEDARRAAKRAFDLPERATTFDRAYNTWNHAARVTRDTAAVRGALDQLIKTYPRDFAARNNSGVYHTGHGEFEAALEDYRQAALRGPDEPVPVINIAYTLLFLGRRDEAYTEIAQYLKTRPDPGVAVTRWVSAEEAHDPRANEFRNAVQTMTPPAQVLGAQSAIAVWRGRLAEFAKLQTDLRGQLKASKNDDAMAAVWVNERMVRAVLERGPAIETLKSALKQSKSAVSVAQGAAVLGSIGDIAAAETFAAAVQSEAANAQAVFIPATVAQAYVRASRGEAKQAAADLDALLAEFPQTLEINYHLGRVREMAGDLNGAAAAYRTVIATLPVIGLNANVTSVRMHLGNVLTKQGDVAGARTQFTALAEQWKDADTQFALLKELKALVK